MSAKLLCRKAEELKSIDELNLSDDIVRLLNSSDVGTEEMISDVRHTDMLRWDDEESAYYLWSAWCDKMPIGNGIDEEECDELVNGKRGIPYVSEIRNSLLSAGFMNSDTRSDGFAYLNEIVEEYFDSNIGVLWYGGGVMFHYREFNRIYESFEVRYEERVKRILNTVKNGLTPNQFNMVKFDLTHPGLRIKYGDSDNWYASNWGENIFAVGKEDYYNLKAARHNCRILFKEKIIKALS